MTSEFNPRDSSQIQDRYTHPKEGEGQGVYIMYQKNGNFSWCPSGNELRRVYLLDPTQWISGPIWLPLSPEDKKRIMDHFEEMCDRF
jgi:hypothetical protein